MLDLLRLSPPGNWLKATLSALLLAGGAFAQESPAPVLTLGRAIELAETNQPRLAAASALVDAAAAGVTEAKAAGMPQLELSADLARTTDPVRVFGGLLAQEKFGPQNFDIAFLNEPDPLTHAVTRLELRAPVYTAGRITAFREAAAAQLDAARGDLERGRQALARQVIDAFTGDLLMADQLRTLDGALAAAEENRKLVADLYASGMVVESDLLQARVRLSELTEQRTTLTAFASVQRAGLNTLLGLPATTVWQLDPDLPELFGKTDTPSGTEADAELSAAIDTARKRRPDLAAATARARAARQMALLRRAERRPEIGAGATVEAASDVPFGISGSHWSVGLSARFKLFDGGAGRSRVTAADAQAAAAEAARLALEQGIELEVRQAAELEKAAQRRGQTANEAVSLARRSLEIVRDRYREGLAPLVELLGAEAALTAAENRVLESRRASWIARAELALATGSL